MIDAKKYFLKIWTKKITSPQKFEKKDKSQKIWKKSQVPKNEIFEGSDLGNS